MTEEARLKLQVELKNLLKRIDGLQRNIIGLEAKLVSLNRRKSQLDMLLAR